MMKSARRADRFGIQNPCDCARSTFGVAPEFVNSRSWRCPSGESQSLRVPPYKQGSRLPHCRDRLPVTSGVDGWETRTCSCPLVGESHACFSTIVIDHDP